MSMFADKMVAARIAKNEREAAELKKGDGGSAIVKPVGLKKGEKRVMVRKGLYEVSRLSDMLGSLASLQKTVAYEEVREGDGSTVSADLKTHLAGLIEVLKSMTAEETSELLAGTEISEAYCGPCY